MTPAREPRPVVQVLGAGVLAGVIAGLATGAIDAVWSWAPARQFVPDFFARLRFVVFSAFAHATAGLAVGLVLAGVLVVLSRLTRLGDIWRDRTKPLRRLSLAIATLPCVAASLFIAYRVVLPQLANRKVPSLVIAASMATAALAILIAIPVAFLLARGIEALLRPSRMLTSPYAPLVAIVTLIAAFAMIWAARDWETARVLPLRGPIVFAIALVLAAPALGPAYRLVDKLEFQRTAIRRGVWVALPIVLLVLVIALGSTSVVKASSSYTGLGGPIARTVRRAFDWDHDGYARVLGGGDCDDGDRNVHPGAPENPDDGIDQNCVGGDATLKRTPEDVAFAPVPDTVPKDFRILLITIDTTRADHLSTYGYKRATSPNIDRLAARGTVFENGWAHAPSTRYSMPAILTGRLPLDVYYDTSISWPGLLPKATTIAELLKPLGFVTGAITNYEYFDRMRHFDQGFDEYDNENWIKHQSVSGAGPEQTKGSSSKEQTAKAIAFVDRHANDRWFLWVHYYDPHFAYEPHAEIKPFGKERVDLYDGEIEFTDLHIGTLIDHVPPNTVVVITGDHGEGFGEHTVMLHGYHLYSPQTKVPLIIAVPGLPPRRATTPAGHVDILPTLVNLAGGKPSVDMMGQSLVGELAGQDKKRVVFQQLSYENNHEMRAGVDGRCHVIYNVSPDTSWEAYRVDEDPLETNDVIDDDCGDTRRAVEQWYDKETIPAGAAEALVPKPAIAAPLDVDYGNARLLAVDAPKTAHPGDLIDITWTFEARGTMDSGWKMFVHIEGPSKTFVNGDHRPARPFEWWKSGEFIRYTTQVTIPRNVPRGAYTINAGLFKGTKRMTAKSAKTKIDNNAAAVATFEVAP